MFFNNSQLSVQSSKWAHAEIFQGKAPTQDHSMQDVVNALHEVQGNMYASERGG
jgi:hypothetical protein